MGFFFKKTVMRICLDNEYSLRGFLYGDAMALAKHGNNINIAKNLRNNFPNPYTVEHARAWIHYIKENEPDCRFVIDYQGEAVGEVGFVRQPDVHRHTAEIGYWLSEEHWGKGVMTKALSEVSGYALNNMDIVRIYADVIEYNNSSMRVLEKCGYEVEGVFKKNIFKFGKYFDHYVYALVV